MYHIKELPEDFVVDEIISLTKVEKGMYSYYQLKKRNINTLTALEKISTIFHLGKKKIGFAGNKDKTAITTQYISILHGPKQSYDGENISVTFIGYGNEPISLGTNNGNYFKIIVRNITKKPEEKKEFINYFDSQRFSQHNTAIGQAIIKKQFKKAVELLQKLGSEYEERLKRSLEEKPTEYIYALESTNPKILSLIINAYQSHLWNETVKQYLLNRKHIVFDDFVFPLEKTSIKTIPLIGFGTDIISLKNEELKKIILDILKKEQISPRDFIIKQLKNMSREGEERNMIIRVNDLKTGNLEDDECNIGKKKVELSFSLPKGSYATMYVRTLFVNQK